MLDSPSIVFLPQTTKLHFQKRKRYQEPMSRTMQLHYLPVAKFSWTDSLLDRISLEWDSRGSAMTNHNQLNDDTASLDRNCPTFTKEKVY